MIKLSTTANYQNLFEEASFSKIIQIATETELNPVDDPLAANYVAASLFKLSNFTECVLWCESIYSSLSNDSGFLSMYGAALRRTQRLQEAQDIFKQAIQNDPNNIFIKNNYANLLIDLSDYSSAALMLSEVLKVDPNYQDAIQNKNRLDFILSKENDLSSSKSSQIDQSGWKSDPLVDAFSVDEVQQMGAINHPPVPVENSSSFDISSLATHDASLELSESLDLARHSVDIDPKSALTDLTHLHKKHGALSPIYNVASDAYIRAKLFQDAEIMLLTSIALGDTSISNYLNLANLAFMRGDQCLSYAWLSKAASIDPNDINLKSVRKKLFPSGAPSSSSNPFQYDSTNIVEGSFLGT